MRPRLLPDGWPRPLGRAAAIFAVLALLWPLAREPAGVGYRAGCALLLRGMGLGGVAEVTPTPGPAAGARVVLRGPGDPAGVGFTLDPWRYAAAPLLVAAALAFAAPARALDRAAALAAALGWTAFSTAITVLRVWDARPGVASPPALAFAVELAYRTAVNPPASEYLAPAFAWLLLVTLRGSGGEGGAPPHPAEGWRAGPAAAATRTSRRRRVEATHRRDALTVPRDTERR